MKIYLSSTFIDLKEHRRAAADAIRRLGDEVVNMETYGSRPEEPTAACLRDIDACHGFVGLYAHRYGHIPSGQSHSITEAEYRHAKSLGKPLFCFLVDEEHPWPPKLVEAEPGKGLLERLKNEIRSSLVADTFTTPDDLGAKLASSLGNLDHWRNDNLDRSGVLEKILLGIAAQIGPFRDTPVAQAAVHDPELKRDIVFLLEAVLSCHASYKAYAHARNEATFTEWCKRVNELAEVIDRLRLALAIHWPELFSVVHEYALDESAPARDEWARLQVSSAMAELNMESTELLLAEMAPLVDREDKRVRPLLRKSSKWNQYTDSPRDDASEDGDNSSLWSTVRRLKEVMRTIMSPSEILSAQQEYAKTYPRIPPLPG